MAFDTANWQWIAENLGSLFIGMAGLVMTGLAVMVSAGQILAQVRRRSSYDKCAYQLSLPAVGLAWALALPAGLSVAMGAASPLFSGANAQQGAALAGGALCLTACRALWRTLLRCPAAHLSLGAFSAALCLFALYSLMGLPMIKPARETLPLLLTGVPLPFWMVPLPPAMAMAGAWGSVWLLFRRDKDDYGRDHYAQMLPWCVSWARNAWVVLWLTLTALFAGIVRHAGRGRDDVELYVVLSSALLLCAVPALLWTAILRSAAPLRRKFLLWPALGLSMTIVFMMHAALAAV